MYTVTYSICSFILGVIFALIGSTLYQEYKGSKKKK